MNSRRTIEIIWEIKDAEKCMAHHMKCMQEEMERIHQQIHDLESSLTGRDRMMALRGGYIYYVIDNDFISRAKVGMTTCGDENKLKSRYRTTMGDVQVYRFEQVNDCKEAERELLSTLHQHTLLWSQQPEMSNSGTELISNTQLSLEIFDDIVKKFNP